MAVERLRMPLLRDSHTHPFLYAAFMDGVNLGADPAETRQGAIRRICAAAEAVGAAGSAERGWTIAYAWNSGRYALSKQDIDDLPPLAVFNLSLHGLIVNDAGRVLLERGIPGIAGKLEDQAWVEANLGQVLGAITTHCASPERLRRFFDWLLAEHGVYEAEEMMLVDECEIGLFEEAGLASRTRFWAAPELYERLPRGLRQRIHGIKLFADGALGARTAALHQPYRGEGQAGILMHAGDELEALVSRYLSAGLPLAVHAIGDRAIDQVISALESVGPPAGSDIRIEHAQFMTLPAARRARAMGIRLCMQPNFSHDSIGYADRLPGGYPERNNPFRMLIDQAGFIPGGDLLLGSDGMPHGFREGLRQSLFPPHAQQALSLQEFTAGYCLPEESSPAGHIEVEIDHDARQVSGRVVAPPEGDRRRIGWGRA